MHNFTSEDLLLFIYKEMSPQKAAALQAAIDTDWHLNEQFTALKATYDSLGQINIAPRQQAIDNILNYASKSVAQLSE
jgi:hypothetical protein